jgi:hypothetical protein
MAFLSGCAGTARGKKDSVLRHDPNLSVLDTSESKADTWVVIRYPAIIDTSAEEAYYRLYAKHAIDGEIPMAVQVRQDTRQIAQSIIAKSSYYAMSLFEELRNNLPENSVLLSPHIIIESGNGGISSRPLLASEEIPSVVTIDFSVYSYPDSSKVMGSPPLTFGDIVTPIFVVHASRWLRPSTHGLLLSSEALLGTAWRQSRLEADMQFENGLNTLNAAHQRPLDFVRFLSQGTQTIPDLPRKSSGEARREVIAVEEYPLEKIRMSGELVAGLASDNYRDPFAEDFVRGAGTRVEIALNRVNHDRATFFTRQRALARFDPALAGAFVAAPDNESVHARLMLAEALIAAEKKFLAAQSIGVFEGTYEGDYGNKMRQMIAAEYRMLEERRHLARVQNATTALFIVAMAGSVYAGNTSSSSGSSGLLSSQGLSTALMMSSIWAMNTARDTKARSDTMGENFLAQMAPALNRQVSVQLEWLQSEEEISAHDFSEFRQKTLALYQSRTRSMSLQTSSECAFHHPQIDTSGRWYGGCAGGQASGSGYGLIRDDSGGSIEFAGMAAEGMAGGTGAMIVRSPGEIGAIYYEGSFEHGMPDGPVLVEAPGRKPRVREFRAGADVGKSTAEALRRMRF